MRTQNEPPGCAEPVSALDWTAASFARTAWQIVPKTVPRLNPTVLLLSGPTDVSVAVTVPATLMLNVRDRPVLRERAGEGVGHQWRGRWRGRRGAPAGACQREQRAQQNPADCQSVGFLSPSQ